MAYTGELDTGLKIYLDNQGAETVIATFSCGPGQMEKSHRDFQIGSWTLPPEIFHTPEGIMLKIKTAEDEHYIHIQGRSMSILSEVPSLSNSQQIQVSEVSCMPTLEPMQPSSI
ncbi:hypothetical protein [Brunnivagina elsteri]|uniref:Uncharacterized protein n=1 Tax=Brunnivagina elsteri CCALA 953 TaxID=987040 RepID=A0A2A2TJ64_9CYAN|nr:hypothetical protein [Calothrix elsteri]PAX54322.1 hypothetical protein CK510_12490 [Calothrix elsteri CCALA 953]